MPVSSRAQAMDVWRAPANRRRCVAARIIIMQKAVYMRVCAKV
jgi:hypothetical protein